MTIDFTPLSMTELRSRPGTILDRVIDNGESFVIERNGRHRACLVPLSVFLPDISPARIAGELRELEEAGESPRTTITDEREIAFLFRRSDKRDAYDIMVTLPSSYPNACPRVYATPIDQRAPHRFPDGALCIFGALSSWNPARDTAYVALGGARNWLKRYESWRKNGNWPSRLTTDAR